jgi:DNA-binding transcriptional ArsR family regulator
LSTTWFSGTGLRDAATHFAVPLLSTLTVTYLFSYIPQVDAVLQALSDPSRRTVLDALSNRPATASELAALLPIARPGTSRHLRVLRDAGLVEVRREAQFRIYSLCPEPLAELDEWLDRYRMLWTHRMEALHTEIARGKRERRSEP